MKKTIYHTPVLFLAVSCQWIFAQPVLTSSNVLTVGDTYTLSEADPTNVAPGVGGENVIWDFSDLTVLESDSTDFVLEYTTVSPENSDFGSDYPEANLVSRVSFADTEEGVTGTALLESFIVANSDSIATVGNVIEFSADGFTSIIPTVFQNPETFIPFPFTFGDSFTDSSRSTTEFTVFTFTSTSVLISADTIEADGYGTLILPSGTFENVLRLTRRSTILQTDDTGSDSIISRLTSIIWLQEDLPSFLLSIDIDAFDDTLETAVIFRSDSAAANLTSIQSELSSNIGLELYPNPAENQLQIQYTLTQTGKMDLAIYDLTGRKIEKVLSEKQSANSYTHQHSLAHLPAGVYLLKLSLDGKADFEKFIKR